MMEPWTTTRRKALLSAAAGGMASAVIATTRASVPQVKQTGYVDSGTLPMKAYSFDLADVTLLHGPFHDNMIHDLNYILAYDCDRLLAFFQKVSRLPTKAPTLGGWDAGGQGGTIRGHYLSACSMMYAYTRDLRLLEKELSKNTVDHFQPGNAASEQRHELSDVENSDTGNFDGRAPQSIWYRVRDRFFGPRCPLPVKSHAGKGTES